LSNNARRTKRMLAGMLAGALALSVSPILGFTGVASAQTEADPIGAGNFCEAVPQTEPFSDITAADPAFGHIVCLVATKITVGFPDGTYRPNAATARRQMALFLTRLADEANRLDAGNNIAALPAYDGTPDFTDHAAEAADQEAAIGRLNQAGIASGFPDGTYKGGASVSRRQMATFVYNLYNFLTGAPLPASATDHFTDDNADSAEQQARTNAVAEAGIFIGNADGTFGPAAPITRRQMARVMTRTLQVLFEKGEITKWAAAGATNQTFTVTGATAAQGFGAAAARTCSVTVPSGTVVDLVLVPTEDITVSGNTVTFADPDSDELFEPAATGGTIIAVNGAPQSADQVNDVTSGGTITVTIQGDTTDDVTLLVFADPVSGDELLNLTNATPDNANPKTPTEQFGIGCRTFFTPPEATLGMHSSADSDVVNRDLDFFVDTTANETYFWDANDVFQFQGIGLTQVQFEGVLSSNPDDDDIDVTYNPDAAGVSTFNITNDDVGTPTGVTATVVNLDSGATINDLRVSFTPDFTNGPATVFDIVADTTADDDITAADTVLANNVVCTPAPATGQCTFTFNNVPNGTYNIIVRAENPPTTQTSGEALSADVTVPGTPDTAGPLAIDTVITTNAGLGGTLDTGDVFKVVFNEALGAPVAGDSIRATDNDGATDTIADFVNGTNATFALNAAAETVNGVSRPAGTVLTVTLTAAPTTVQAGLVAGLQIPATITDQSGTADAVGNLWSIAAANQDLVIDQDADDAQNNSLDAAPATFVAGGTDTVQTFTANEDIDCASVATADVTITASIENIVSVTCDAATDVITVTLDNELDAGETVALEANQVLDAAGNPSPAADVTYTGV
jgi:hypothetical protein